MNVSCPGRDRSNLVLGPRTPKRRPTTNDGVVEGIGVTLVGIVADDCRLLLEQTSVASGQNQTLFQASERLGAEYPPESDNTCATRDDLAAEWRSWTAQPCVGFEVIHARFAEDP
jgi:hypothetical protein